MMAYRVNTSLLNRYHPTFKFENVPPGFFDYPGAIKRGVVLKKEDVPASAVEQSKFKKIPDIFNIQGSWVVCESFRNIVEDCEPGVHQFFPIILKQALPIANLMKYYIINILQFIDSVNTEESEIRWRNNSITGELKPGFGKMNPRIVFHKSLIENKHIWRGKTELTTYVFFSNYLVNEINKLKLKKLDLDYGEEK